MWIISVSLLIGSILLLSWLGSLLVASAIGSPIVNASPSATRACWKLAGLSHGQTVVDLGCGDARALIMAVKDFGAKGIGVERSLFVYCNAKIIVWLKGQTGNIKIIWGNFHSVEKELAAADVVYLYLFNETLTDIERWLF